MLFRQLMDKESGTFTYLLADDYGSDALIIDPVLEQLALYNRLIKEFDLTLRYALDTHSHADHVTATGALRQHTGCKVVMGEATQTHHVDLLLKNNETLELANIHLTALYTPGHTADSYCYLGDDMVFTGDTLFIRSTGRTDLLTGNTEQAFDSLFNKLLNLPEATLVYPGHDYKVMTVSTIGEEKRFNPRLQVDKLEDYAAIMNQLNLSKPDQFQRALELNPNCGLTN